MQHRRSIFSKTSWKVSAEHRDRKDVSGPTVRAKNQSMKQKQISTNGRNGWWNESKNDVSLFRKKYRACWLILCLHDDLKNVGTMRIDWNDRSKKKIRRCWQPSCIAEPRFVKLFLWSYSLSSSISNPNLCADWILTDWNSATAGAMRRGGDASLCVLFRSNLLTLAIQYFN